MGEPAIDLNTAEADIRRRFHRDFVFYAEKCLVIRPKSGGEQPFTLNEVQRHVHAVAQRQMAERGFVRVIVVKARQHGVSTYVEGRFFWKTTHRRGWRAFILTHKDSATANLFNMAKRFWDRCPPEMKPVIKASNAKELIFGGLDSGYVVGTAKTAGVGRSDTIQMFHGSEVALWPNAQEHASGALEAVPSGGDAKDTEIWLESTGQGPTGFFHGLTMSAIRGKNDFEVVFIPWFWHRSYKTEPPEGWASTDEWREYGELYDLSPAQIFWAQQKNAFLAAADKLDPDRICWRFRQEYPATLEEAFQVADVESFIPSQLIVQARKRSLDWDMQAPLIYGVDAARGGPDKTKIWQRRGRKARRVMTLDTDDTMEIAGHVGRLIDANHPAKVNIDVGGVGAGVYDRLVEAGRGNVVNAIDFGSSALDKRSFANKRAEMWSEMREWLAQPGGVDLEDDDEIHTCLVAPRKKHRNETQLLLESKDSIRARLNFSPDDGDALALTFAEAIVSGQAWDKPIPSPPVAII